MKTFEEANEYLWSLYRDRETEDENRVFGLKRVSSICEVCTHREECVVSKTKAIVECKFYIEHLENEKDFSKFGGILRDEKGREIFVTPDKHECLADYND